MNPTTDPMQLPNAYWVIPGKLMAGAYPSDPRGGPAAREKVRLLLVNDFSVIVDLTEPGEYNLNMYADWLEEEARLTGKTIRHLRSPIRDLSIPTFNQMQELLDQMDAALNSGQKVYVHCFGGRGRTGTAVGCYLVRHGLNGQAALDEIQRLRRGIPNIKGDSPETFAQKSFVINWDTVSGER